MKGYRTIVWNVANAIVPAMEIANATYQIPDEWMPLWLFAFIAGNVVLRLVTTGPVGSDDA